MAEQIHDPVRDLVAARLTEKRLDMAKVSRQIAKNPAYIQQFLTRGSPADLPEKVREALAPILDVPADALRLSGGAAQRSTGSIGLPPSNRRDQTPVYGGAQGGSDGRFIWNGQVIDWTATPPALAGAANSYALYVFGTSMEPKFEEGSLVYVHPHKPVSPGCFVVAQIRPKNDDEMPLAFVKRFARRTPTKIVLEQFNPPKTFDFADKDVDLHRIVGTAER